MLYALLSFRFLMKFWKITSVFFGGALALAVPSFAQILGGEVAPLPTLPPPPSADSSATPAPNSGPAPFVSSIAPPRSQAYIATEGGPARLAFGRTLVPTSFFVNGLGASVGPVGKNHWRLVYFDKTIDFYPYQRGVLVNGSQAQLQTHPQVFGQTLYVPMGSFAEILGLKWSVAPGYKPGRDQQKTVILIQYDAAFIQNVESRVEKDRVRTIVTLSNPTRVVARLGSQDATWEFAGARETAIPSIQQVSDYLVPYTRLTSGNWNAKLALRLNYRAPIRWFTTGSPTRIVIDSQRLFEEQSAAFSSGLKVTKIRRGLDRGPVQMYVARLDPRDGWRVRVANGGETVLQRARPSRIAARSKAVLAVNGGFFAYDGAAVGAVMARGEWIRLPWNGRTAVGFTRDGKATIANLQVDSHVSFSSGLKVPIRDLNGWPDKNRITALTRRFGTYYKLRAGEIGVVVSDGVVTSTPGGGGFNIPQNGFALVANGGAVTVLRQVKRGLKARMTIQPRGAWPKNMVTALGGGPRLVKNGQVAVSSEGFRSDVLRGAGPRTAFGVDKYGRYIILVADGRQRYHSVGLTLHELAATMQKLGAVNALNLDGGGSTAMVVRGRVVNRPSDGRERGVANALLVTR